ncbi:hypothetical protein N7461_000855 [Penicillium sp. DV-2018c]|nr:hypothetical protein N7461_000855 [Penicillium sp. DV-2018c]
MRRDTKGARPIPRRRSRSSEGQHPKTKEIHECSHDSHSDEQVHRKKRSYNRWRGGGLTQYHPHKETGKDHGDEPSFIIQLATTVAPSRLSSSPTAAVVRVRRIWIRVWVLLPAGYEVQDKQKVYHNLVRETLSSMPLGTTEQWSKTQLDDETRSRLRSIRSMKEWYKLLSEKFSTNIGDAVRDFQALQYTLWDVYERHDPADFLQNVVILGQESNIAPTSNTQAVSAYNKLHVSLQLWLTKPNQDTTMTSFMRQVDDVKGQWYKTQIGMSPSSTQP